MEKETFNEKLLRKELKDLQGAYDIALSEINKLNQTIETRKGKYLYNHASWDERDRLTTKIEKLEKKIKEYKKLFYDDKKEVK